MYKIRPIGRDEEGHPQGARYVAYSMYEDVAVYYIDFEVEVTDEWESSRDMPGGWDYEMSNLRVWYGHPPEMIRPFFWKTLERVRGPLPRELERGVYQYIEDNPEEFLGQEVR